jgi:hypothetical protein
MSPKEQQDYARTCLDYIVEQAKAGVAATQDGDIQDVDANAKVVRDYVLGGGPCPYCTHMVPGHCPCWAAAHQVKP